MRLNRPDITQAAPELAWSAGDPELGLRPPQPGLTVPVAERSANPRAPKRSAESSQACGVAGTGGSSPLLF
jgi:hypothetical protein